MNVRATRSYAAPIPNHRRIALDAALTQLAITKPDHAKLIELHYFTGLTGDDVAAVLGISPATADRMWRNARAWSQIELQKL